MAALLATESAENAQRNTERCAASVNVWRLDLGLKLRSGEIFLGEF